MGKTGLNKYRHDHRTERTKYYQSISIKGQLEEHPNWVPLNPELFKKTHKRYKVDVWIYDKRIVPSKRPPRDVLINDLRTLRNYNAVGRKYSVDASSVKKWCRKYKLPDKKSKLKLLTSWDWDKLLAEYQIGMNAYGSLLRLYMPSCGVMLTRWIYDP